MSREIKFRAWDKERKEMIIVEKIDFRKNYITYDDDIISSPLTSFELMQFTGFKDRDGKEIYEGDILIWENKTDEPDNDEKLIVEFTDGYFTFKFENHPMSEWDLDSYIVIGNIYKNPELLEESA